jgi:mannose-6-phosphate isomerase-like protein (cupin superfamily)
MKWKAASFAFAFQRLMARDTSALFDPKARGGQWQDAHYHESVQETYIVQRGWIGFADQVDGRLRVRVLQAGDIVTTQPYVRHNVFMSAGAVIHTVTRNRGQSGGQDQG